VNADRTLRLGIACAAALLALTGCSGLHHSRGWKLADLDRNWLNLATFRGMSDADTLAQGMPNADAVISAKGKAERTIRDQPDPLKIEVRYVGDDDEYTKIPDECFLFTFPDGYDVDFHRVDCPKG
jgi:hypothetical protein